MKAYVIVTDNNFIISGLNGFNGGKTTHLYYRDFIKANLKPNSNTVIFDISDWQDYMIEAINKVDKNNYRVILWDSKNTNEKVISYKDFYLLMARDFSDFLLGINKADKNISPGPAIFHITPNEMRVIRLLSLGYNLTSTSTMLKKSIRTVSGQKKSLMRRLGIKNNVGLFCFMSIFFRI